MTTRTEHFVVDAALLEELGARLVGRPDVALSELIKNAFDADAFTCQVEFGDGYIEVTDDGHAMSWRDFKNHWLRLGTQHKSETKVSRELKRPLTGSKGIGRLSAQFLANKLELWTTPEDGKTVHAEVNWSQIRHGSELSSFEVEVNDDATPASYPHSSVRGTKLRLTDLRQEWSPPLFKKLGRDVWALRNPFRRRLSNRAPETRGPEDFEIEFAAPAIRGAQEQFEAAQQTLMEDAWKARITGRLTNGREGGACRIEVEFRENYPRGAEKESYVEILDNLPLLLTREDDDDLITNEDRKPHLEEVIFHILIYKLDGRQPGGLSVDDLRDVLRKQGNVRIYDSGFRLPFYGPDEDWTYAGRDQANRLTKSNLLPAKLDLDLRYLLDLPDPRNRTLGAVQINTSRERDIAKRHGASPGHWLEIQASRDRLQQNAAFVQLRRLVRYGLDFYANRYAKRYYEVGESERYSFGQPIEVQERARTDWQELKRQLPPDTPKPLIERVDESFERVEASIRSAQQHQSARAALLAPLAAAGMRAVALDHEMRREIGNLVRTAKTLDRLAKEYRSDELAKHATEIREGAERLKAMRNLFSALLDEEDREKRERYVVAPVVNHVVRSMKPLMPGVEFTADIDSDLRFPPAPYAAWSAMFQNILSNAWDAMLDTDRSEVHVESAKQGRRTVLRVSDTGVGLQVSLEEAQTLFEPFERREVTGPDRRSMRQGGSGLGLAIVRLMAETYDCEVRFVAPREGFATTLEVSWNE